MGLYLNVIDVVTVPGCAEELVAESQNEDVLHHLLAEVVIDTEDLLLLPVWLESPLQFARASKVLSERFLDLQFGQLSARLALSSSSIFSAHGS